jgi:hypothetical protein
MPPAPAAPLVLASLPAAQPVATTHAKTHQRFENRIARALNFNAH